MSEEAPKLPAGEAVNVNNLSLSDNYWAVTLDGKVTKTMYKDNLMIPTKAMAVALAEEWDSQQEHINLKTLYLVSFASLIFKHFTEQFPCKMCQSSSRYDFARFHERGIIYNP